MAIPGSAGPFLLAQLEEEGGYEIERSLRFNSSDSAYLSRTPGSASNRKTWTWAGWVKRSALGGTQRFFIGGSTGAGGGIQFSSDVIEFFDYPGGYAWVLTTTQVFRDTSAWYHILASIDTTQATSSNRAKVYVNGTQVTAFSTSSYPTLNYDGYVNSTVLHALSSLNGTGDFFNGYLADIHFIDGQALDPSSFTETDANGVLQPKAYTGSYGTNGFHLPFSDNSTAAALGTDTSSNGNNWTPNNFSVATTGVNYTAGSTFPADAVNTAGLFSGSSSNYTNFGSGGASPSGTTRTFSFTNLPTVTSLLRLKVYNGEGAGSTIKVNGGTAQTVPYNYPSGGYFTFTGVTTVSSITYTYGGGNLDQAALMVIEIDGTNVADFKASNNDSLVDSPTNGDQTDTGAGGEVVGNYCTINAILPYTNTTISNGNLDFVSGATYRNVVGTFGVASGKWYWEITVNSWSSDAGIGITNSPNSVLTSYLGSNVNGWAYSPYPIGGNGSKYNFAAVAYGSTYTNGDIIGVAFDADNGTLAFYKNGTSQGNAFTSLAAGTYFPSFGGGNTTSMVANFGQRAFAYTAPSGFKALCTTNLPEPTIADGSTVMDVLLWSGTGGNRSFSSLNMSPDFVWIKQRNQAFSTGHQLYDIVRGAGSDKELNSSGTAAEGAGNIDQYGWLSSFDSNGFSVTAGPVGDDYVNASGTTYAAWTWDAGSSTVTNTAGSITSQVRANASAGFSIVKYTNVASTNSTIGHGLGVAPKLVIVRYINNTSGWYTYHADTGAGKYLELQSTGSADTLSSMWNNTAPTSTVFSVGTAWNITVDNIAYCFAPVAGYSSAFTWSGTGSTDGPAIYLGFRPKLIIWKRTDSAANWAILDSSRSSYNVADDWLGPNSSSSEAADNAAYAMDFLSNGLKIRATHEATNQSGGTYVGFAWAESPFQYARAR